LKSYPVFVVGDGVLIARDRAYAIAAVAPASLEVRWRYSQPDAFGSPIAVVNEVVCADVGERLVAINLTNGERVWQTGVIDGLDGLAVSDPLLVARHQISNRGEPGLICLGRADEHEQWRVDYQPAAAGPVAVGSEVYVVADGSLRAVDAATGAERWSFPLPSAAARPPRVVDGVAYVRTYDSVVAIGGTGAE
jgi:outer membrane protein assembly factor BamB